MDYILTKLINFFKNICHFIPDTFSTIQLPSIYTEEQLVIIIFKYLDSINAFLSNDLTIYTDHVFESLEEASEFINLSKNFIIKTKIPNTNKWTWQIGLWINNYPNWI